MADFPTLDDIDVAGKRVLLRGDLNVPMKDGRVTDTTRLDRLAPTISELGRNGARVIVLSHFGRPKGRPDAALSLAPVAKALSEILGKPVRFAEDCVGDAASAVVESLEEGEVAVLENLRFHKGEEANDPDFAARLAELGDFYVNDAFSAAHRAHASTEALARLLPAAAGRLMEAELTTLSRALDTPDRPLAVLVGGAKISTKLDLLGNLVAKVDRLIIGGGMANTFLNAKGIEIGASLAEHDMADAARAVMARAEAEGCAILLPSDAVVATEFKAGAASDTVAIESVPADKMILDAGPATIARLNEEIGNCRTLVWNGPLGAFEIEPFDAATNAVAREAARLTEAGRLLTVAGGGDTVAALVNAGVAEAFSYVSTAGGAFLEWLEGRDLPGVAALKAANTVT